jgi:hypothetical protein
MVNQCQSREAAQMSAMPSAALASFALAAVILAVAPRCAAAASTEARPDADFVADCVREVASRDFEGVAADHLLVSSSEVRRGATEDIVRIAVASGEGRSARATCKFRGGKLFDVLR